jgi:hypothetical protein
VALLIVGAEGTLEALAPFRRGVMVMGSVVFFLALLILSSG